MTTLNIVYKHDAVESKYVQAEFKMNLVQIAEACIWHENLLKNSLTWGSTSGINPKLESPYMQVKLMK